MENLKEMFKSRNVWIVLLLIAFVIVFFIYIKKRKREDAESSFAEKVREDAVKDKVTEKELELNQYMRKLLGENTIWMRNYTISYMANHTDMKDVTQRLMKNQAEIGKAFGLWFGKEKGNAIGDLMSKNLISFGDILKGMMDKNKNESIISEKLVDYLVKINPKWSKTDLGHNFKKYNEMFINSATARYRKKHNEEIEAFDKAHNYAMHDLADYITKGIVDEFPEKFDKKK